MALLERGTAIYTEFEEPPPPPLTPDVDIRSLLYEIFRSNRRIVYQNRGHKLPKF